MREGGKERERERERGRERKREGGREGERDDSLDHKKWQMCLHFSVLDPDGYFHLDGVLLVCLYQLE